MNTRVQELEEEPKENNMKWDVIGLGEVRSKEEIFTTLQSGHLLYNSEANNGQAGVGFLVNKKWKDNITRKPSGSSRVAELVLRITGRYQLKSFKYRRQRHLTQMKRQTTSTTPLIRSWKSKHITPLRWGTLMRKLEDNQIHQKGRQDASAWASEMKEETNHCLILCRHLTCSSWLVLQNASKRQKTLP